MNGSHLSQPQAIGVPGIHNSRAFVGKIDNSIQARSLPRAIPNARSNDVPGIPSMEPPQTIFGDHRHRLPQLSALSNDVQIGGSISGGRPVDNNIPGGRVHKGGIQGLKEQYIRNIDAMEVDSKPKPSTLSFEATRRPSQHEPNFTTAGTRIAARPPAEAPKDQASVNDNLRGEGNLQDVIMKSSNAYDDSLLRKLTSPVLPLPFPGSATAPHPPADWPVAPSLKEDRHNSITMLPASEHSQSTGLPSMSKIPQPTPSPLYETHSNTWSRSPLSNSTITSPHLISSRSIKPKDRKRREYSPMRDPRDPRYARERSPPRGLSDPVMAEEEYELERLRRSRMAFIESSRSYRGHSRRRRSPSYPSDEDIDMDDLPPEPKLRRLTLLTQGPSSGHTLSESYPSPRREKRRYYSPSREERHSRRYYSPDREDRHRRYYSPERDDRHVRRGYSPMREERHRRRYYSRSRERERYSRRHFSPSREDRIHLSSEPSKARYLHEHGIDLNKATLSGRGVFKSQSGPPSSMASRYSQPHSSLVSSQSSGWSFQASYEGDRASSVTSFSPESDPGHDSISGDSPYLKANPNIPKSLSGYPRGHQRTVSEAVARQEASIAAIGPKHHSAPKMLGALMCECCPKKPKKFDNRLDLQMHEMEKQYMCAYCPHRFKNKNEAERHQNSLHLRKHSWSCAALQGVEAAFHPSVSKPHMIDICGYCGAEFRNPADWEERMEHLSNVHKYGECNQQKKFYRADHFRQHLKHSHAGTSGKWANILENACRRDEIGGITEETTAEQPPRR